jgi:hypothetical protein
MNGWMEFSIPTHVDLIEMIVSKKKIDIGVWLFFLTMWDVSFYPKSKWISNFEIIKFGFVFERNQQSFGLHINKKFRLKTNEPSFN